VCTLSDKPAAEAPDSVLGPLVRVIDEASGDEPWALIGSTSLRLQGIPSHSPNLEFITSAAVVEALASMLGLETDRNRSQNIAATRLQFLRHGVPVFVFAEPIFHGRYDSLKPLEIPSLWDARVRSDYDGVRVPCTPLEWELLLSVILQARQRAELLRQHLRTRGFDSRLIVRLLREGHVDRETEEAVWSVLEHED
jgi:hypothetical protein